jgi:hypothetical protein
MGGWFGGGYGCSNEQRELFRNPMLPWALGPELCEAESSLVPTRLEPTDLESPPAARLGQQPAAAPPLAAAWEELQHPTEKNPSHLERYRGGGAAWKSTETEPLYTACRHNTARLVSPRLPPKQTNPNLHDGDRDTAGRNGRKCDVQGTYSPTTACRAEPHADPSMQDKEKPLAVRSSNIVAARGMQHHIVHLPHAAPRC